MLMEIFSDTEYYYEVRVFCPKCGSDNVVVEFVNGFFYFSSCNSCGHRAKKELREA